MTFTDFILASLVVSLFILQIQSFARLRSLEARLGELRAELALRRPSAPAEAANPEAELAEPTPPARETIGGLFERLVGGRLLIWIGGIALAAAGIFLIRHSIALLTPETRMMAAALLGVALVAAGEYARAGRLLADDPRIGQALVGAGIAILYAAVYGSYALFGLIGSGTASALMLAITAAALGLSLRHGAPTALMGLVGGFLTPLLVGDPKSGALPVLLYIALLDVAIFVIAWRRGWAWLPAAAVAASFAWTGYFMLAPPGDALAAGIFAVLLGVAASLPGSKRGGQLALLQPPIIGLGEIAILVARPEIGVEAWLLFGALAAATLPISLIRPEHRLTPPVALLIGLLLVSVQASDPAAPWAAALATIMFAGASAPLARRDGAIPALTACLALAGPLLILRQLRPELLPLPLWGGIALLLSLFALALLRLIRAGPHGRDTPDVAGVAAGATAALLLAAAGYDLVPHDLASGAWLVAAVGLLLAGVRLPDKALRLAGLLLLTATIVRVFLMDAADLEGILRILSFLALGAALIWIGRFYPKVLNAERGGGSS